MITIQRLVVVIMIALLVQSALPANAQDAATTKITIINDSTQSSLKVYRFIDQFQQPEEFALSNQNVFTFSLKHQSSNWYSEVVIKLDWGIADFDKVGNYEQFLYLRIPRVREVFQLNVNFTTDVTTQHMTQLEGNQNDLAKYLFAYRIWNYYHTKLPNKTDALVRRAANLWYSAAFALARSEPYFFVMSPEAVEAVVEADPPNAERNIRQAEEAKSMYWIAIRQVDTYVQVGNCPSARLLLEDYERRYESESDLASRRWKTVDNIVKAKRSFLDSHCPQQTAAMP